MDKLLKEELDTKINFVKEISLTVAKYIENVNEIKYDVFYTKNNNVVTSRPEEFLVFTYKGGGMAVRNCAINSLSAILEEISKLINGGYYDEVGTYRRLKENSIPFNKYLEEE